VRLDNSDIIKKIIRLEEGRAEIIIRVYCPFCRVKSALLLIGKTGRYECQVCHKHGKLTDLVVYFRGHVRAQAPPVDPNHDRAKCGGFMMG